MPNKEPLVSNAEFDEKFLFDTVSDRFMIRHYGFRVRDFYEAERSKLLDTVQVLVDALSKTRLAAVAHRDELGLEDKFPLGVALEEGLTAMKRVKDHHNITPSN